MPMFGRMLIFLMLCGCHVALWGQSDSALSEDSTDQDASLEKILDQTPVGEDSPLLDLLPSGRSRIESHVEFRSRLSKNLQPSKGFQEELYRGSSAKLYQRLKVSRGSHFSAGILLEKDAGEERFNQFTTAHMVWNDVGPISTIVLGDYLIEAGQGVTLWRGFEYSKGAEIVLPVLREAKGLSPYLSSDENNFFRGVAAEVIAGPFSSTLFFSRAFRSAYLDTLGRATSLYTSGYFRTTTEKEKEGNFDEKSIGGRVVHDFQKDGQIGLTMYSSAFGRPLILDDGKRFQGEKSTAVSIDYRFAFHAATLFGEWAQSNHEIGGISGALLSVSPSTEFIAAVRHYPYRFLNLHGLGFGERTFNEDGVYVGLRFRSSAKVELSTYIDQFHHPEGRPFSESGNDFLMNLEYHPTAKLALTIRYQRKIVPFSAAAVDEFGLTRTIEDQQRNQKIRFDIDNQLTTLLGLRTRIERTYFATQVPLRNEKGLMVYEDLRYRLKQNGHVNLRIIYFESDSYDVGTYEFERDLPGVLTLPVLYGRGVRWYLLFRYNVSQQLSLGFKYSNLLRDDIKRIGSGLDQLPDNHSDRLSFQFDLRF